MTAEKIAKALGGRKCGQGWAARCPVHEDHHPSLSIHEKDGKVLVHCHAGCDQSDVIASLRQRGLLGASGASRSRKARRNVNGPPQIDEGDLERRRFAVSIWRSAVPANGTPVETYLAPRGLILPPTPSVRFHPRLRHRPSGRAWPGMVALVMRGTDGTFLGIHRTYLALDGTGKAPVEPARMMLGPCRGGAVRLAEAGSVLMVGEGIETCLAAMQATGKPAWAALSASGLAALEVPGCVREVIILADGDDAGERTAQDCARRLMRQGRRVRIARPPRGMDFNDLLLGQSFRCGEGKP
jgi:hypothetical protein